MRILSSTKSKLLLTFIPQNFSKEKCKHFDHNNGKRDKHTNVIFVICDFTFLNGETF